MQCKSLRMLSSQWDRSIDLEPQRSQELAVILKAATITSSQKTLSKTSTCTETTKRLTKTKPLSRFQLDKYPSVRQRTPINWGCPLTLNWREKNLELKREHSPATWQIMCHSSLQSKVDHFRLFLTPSLQSQAIARTHSQHTRGTLDQWQLTASTIGPVVS